MSTKRGYVEADSQSVEADSQSVEADSQSVEADSQSVDAEATPYATYQEAHEALQALRRSSAAEILEHSQRALLTVTACELPSAVRQIGVRLATHLCAHPEPSTTHIAAALVRALELAEPSVRCEIYAALISLHELKADFFAALPPSAADALARSVKTDTNHSQHHLRSAAVACLQHIGGASQEIRRFATDAHPKVRQTALFAIQRQQMLGLPLAVEMYDECVAATKDDSEQVRLIAVDLVWAIGSRYPEHPVVLRARDTLRLLDDAFVKVCDMVNDSAMRVRQRACLVLGRFRTVSARFLEQTFSKQVMSHLRAVPRHTGYAGRNRGLHSSKFHRRDVVDEAGANKFHKRDVVDEAGANRPRKRDSAGAGVAPKREDEELRLLDSGAAGAFVHGLEDEFQEVRDAAIESILELSAESPVFAAKAVDFLVDMFNDSSDRVRVRAIRALTSMGSRAPIHLTDEQLSIAVSAIKDASPAVRLRICEFLAVSVVPASALQLLMRAFADNLEKYAEDQMPIYRALARLGMNHSHVVGPQFVRSLLGISQHYLSREARIDDVVYAGNVILVANTRRATRAAVAHVLPDYVFGHLPYLCDKYPGCLPANLAELVPARLPFVRQMLERPAPDALVSQLSLDDAQRGLVARFAHMQAMLEAACGPDPPDARAADELSRAARAFQQSAAAECRQTVVALYAGLVSVAITIQLMFESADTLQGGELRRLTARLMHGSYGIEARTHGLDPQSRASLTYLRVFAHTAWLGALALQQYDPRVSAKLCDELQQRCVSASQQLSKHESLEAAIELLHALSAEPTLDSMRGFIRGFRALAFAPRSRCQYARAEVQVSESRHPREFDHRFPLRVPVEARVCWAARNVAVTVTHPTQDTRVWRVPQHALKPQGPMQWALQWDVDVVLPLGSGEPAVVQLAVALEQPSDMPWSDAFVVGAQAVPLTYDIADYYKTLHHRDRVEIQVSEPQAVSISPIEMRPQASLHTRI